MNLLRSEIASTVASAPSLTLDSIGVPLNLDLTTLREALPMSPAEAPQRSLPKLSKRPKLAAQPAAERSFVNVFVEVFRDSGEGDEGEKATLDRIRAIARSAKNDVAAEDRAVLGNEVLVRRNFVSATIPIAALTDLEQDPGIAFVHPSQPLTFDEPIDHPALNGAPNPRGIGDSKLRAAHGDGDGVIIGLIDVGGFDFAHEDFRDAAGKTRFLSIWDQGGDFRKPPSANGASKFDYGSELTKPLMDAAIATEAAGKFPATMVERQSQRTEGSHATHVASIAAGNRGVCPKAEIAAVLISVPVLKDTLAERRATFSDSTRIVHAVEHLLEIARSKKKPISINISLGTNGGAHDGSSGVSRWLDALLSDPGRAVTVAAGNAGQEKGVNAEDLGFITGRVHSSGRIASRGLSVDLEWTVVGNGIEDLSENELEIWYGAQDRLTVMLKPPSAGADWIAVRPREFVENRRLPSGTTVSIYNELYHPTNGSNYAAIYLTPNLQPGSIRGVEAGVWRVRLVGDEIRNGRFNCWIERDDPVEIRSAGPVRLFRFPSFFSEVSNVDSHSISSLACGHRVISVANLDDARQRINVSSSQGPTRDDRSKPDIAAPGTDIIAAKGFTEDDKVWIGKTGTSMASPYVAGVVGLMLSANKDLTSAQCSGILQRTARPLPGASFEWRNDAGFGVIDPAAAIDEARTFNQRVEV
ncbi:S8 family serine peptidase [Bradyrhizobium sp. AUGA SZCCT0160]|uniref:S8 family serine peptidase n=1 Tax=Bradyrhizobium sp. AUGA SZCCT0160 TaxID=2807662 RepID=UPI001BA4B479|nr:S8 family serine peptidase [Bradyrhizobium sp. AUGA SZCCT0160]MBR1188561.1 S8 family serine peptidase [Bradyrhizobium sp. AUGA SZCCT0160]